MPSSHLLSNYLLIIGHRQYGWLEAAAVCHPMTCLSSPDISSVTATADMTVLPGILGCSFGFAQDRLPLRRTVQVRLGSNSLRLPGGTPFSAVSRHQFVKQPG